MGTVVTVQVVGHGSTLSERSEREAAVSRALGWFSTASDHCTRFDPASEVNQLCARIGEAVPVSDLLFETVRFAIAVAEESDGAFDPTVGALMEARGFNRDYRTGATVRMAADNTPAATWRDVTIDDVHRTVTVHAPLVLDLGAVAKGLAIDLAARELEPFRNFAIDAGGDLYLGGQNAAGEAWTVGIRHPRAPDALLTAIQVSDRAVCTSGDYERAAPGESGDHHIMDPRSAAAATACASVTVIASSAMVADAMSTAAFVLGPSRGLALLEQNGLDGLLVTRSLERHATTGWVDA